VVLFPPFLQKGVRGVGGERGKATTTLYPTTTRVAPLVGSETAHPPSMTASVPLPRAAQSSRHPWPASGATFPRAPGPPAFLPVGDGHDRQLGLVVAATSAASRSMSGGGQQVHKVAGAVDLRGQYLPRRCRGGGGPPSLRLIRLGIVVRFHYLFPLGVLCRSCNLAFPAAANRVAPCRAEQGFYRLAADRTAFAHQAEMAGPFMPWFH